MNLIEFSIACKLISCKLRNVEVPKQLPPTLIASLQHIGTPIRTPTGAMSPTESYKQFLTQQPATVVPMVQPMVQSPPPSVMMMSQGTFIQPQQPPIMMPSNQSFVAQQAAPINIVQQPIAQVQAIPQQMMMPQVPPQQQLIQQTVIPTAIPHNTNFIQQAAVPIQMAPVQASMPPLIEQLSSGSLLDNLSQLQSTTISSSGPLPAAPTPTPPQSGHASRSMSFSEKAPSIPESP